MCLSACRRWAEEVDSSILLLNNGFLEAEQKRDNFDTIFASSRQWIAAVGLSSMYNLADCLRLGVTEAAVCECDRKLEAHIKQFRAQNGEFERIFVRDAERAFRTTHNREIMMHILVQKFVIQFNTCCLDNHAR